MKFSRSAFAIFSLSIVVVCFLSTCTSEKGTPNYNDYPDDIGKIMFTKCATPGCHTDASKDGAAGLSLEGWDKMFAGGTGSACVIPFRSDYSTMFYFVNTFSDLGMALTPTMPYQKPALSKDEVTLIKNWIDAGAPNRDGFVKFSDNPARKKFYVTNQGCDVITVFDEATLLPIRYINVGSSPGVESPHLVRVSPDGQFWYVCFANGTTFQKYRTSDDSFVGEATIGFGLWNSFVITNDGLKAFVVDWSSPGTISEVNLTNMAHLNYSALTPAFPHGSCLNPAGDTIYVTDQNGSELTKIPTDISTTVSVTLGPSTPNLMVHDVRFAPTGTEYFVTCQGTSQVKIFAAGTDQLLATLPVGAMPSEIVFSTSKPYAFITCMEDVSVTGKRGSVYVINYNTNTFVAKIYTGHQPHGIDVDDAKKLVYVVNRNFSSDGPAPHHSGVCGGRNGNVSFIDLNTLNMVTLPNSSTIKKVEIASDPYAVSIRH